MTLDEFLTALRERCSPRTFRTVSKNWGEPQLIIRTRHDRCPIAYMARCSTGVWLWGARRLSLEDADAHHIAQAADRSDHPLRRRLEYACRLRESED